MNFIFSVLDSLFLLRSRRLGQTQPPEFVDSILRGHEEGNYDWFEFDIDSNIFSI